MSEFLGQEREDGSVGIRNRVAFISTAPYANDKVKRAADIMDDTVPIRHPLGRCQTKPKVFQNYRTLLGWETLPNVYRPAVIAHAGEIVHGDELAADVAETGRATASVIIHHEKGVMNALKTTVNAAQEIVREASGQNRVPADYSNLTFGIN